MPMEMNLPGIHGGVSQQSELLRLPHQVAAAENVVFDMVEGLRLPRWGTFRQSIVYTPSIPLKDNAFIGTLETSDDKRWWITIEDSDTQIVLRDLTGVVTKTAALSSVAQNYLYHRLSYQITCSTTHFHWHQSL